MLLLFTLPIIVVHILFKIHPQNDFFVAEWSSGDVLSYIGGFLSFLGTFALGVITIYLNNNANKTNERLLELEYTKHQPYLTLNKLEYDMYIPNEEDYMNSLKNIRETNLMQANVSLIKEPQSINSYQMDMLYIVFEVKNVGKADIQKIFINDLKIANLPIEFDKSYSLSLSNNSLYSNSSKSILLKITLESQNDYDFNIKNESILSCLPRITFDLKLVTFENLEYNEKLELATNIYNDLKSNKSFRSFSVSNFSINKM